MILSSFSSAVVGAQFSHLLLSSHPSNPQERMVFSTVFPFVAAHIRWADQFLVIRVCSLEPLKVGLSVCEFQRRD